MAEIWERQKNESSKAYARADGSVLNDEM